MVRRGTPKDKENYIAIEDERLIYTLNAKGFLSEYIDFRYVWFKKTNEIEEVIKRVQ